MEMRIFTVTLLYLMATGAGALEVSIPEEQYEYARGDNITLPCSFQSVFPRPSQVIILWSVEGLEANADEKMVATYYSSDALTNFGKAYERRAALDVDLATGKADLKLTSISLADNKEFECRALIPGDSGGTLFDTTRLVVLVAPSPPICKIEGKEEYGQNINLTCFSEEGSPPPQYEWTSLNARNVPHVKDPRTTSKGGVLSLFNISKETSGYYTCTSSNKIRSAICNITVTVMPPSMNIGSTAGIIAGVVAVLIILVVVIYCCCCRKKNEEEEYALGVREEGHPEKVPDRNGDERSAVRRDDESSERAPLRERYEEGRRDPDDRRSDYDDRRSDYDDRRRDPDDRRRDPDDRRRDPDDRRRDPDDRRRDPDDRRRDPDDRRRDPDDRRSDYTDRRSDYSNVRDEYSREH
ncbi:cell surface A33 antigen-like [Syngnathoides biaculeatus]|uniref:cell surface A33 antigen-like n=1 Tax=Syngnathoides biaculeatus TaxID=300417 RepID=UPI002ADDDB87|nr:cell surface A33 antigen-like [Syngnathoides biaculeatus]